MIKITMFLSLFIAFGCGFIATLVALAFKIKKIEDIPNGWELTVHPEKYVKSPYHLIVRWGGRAIIFFLVLFFILFIINIWRIKG